MKKEDIDPFKDKMDRMKKKKIDGPVSLSDELITIVHKAVKNEKKWAPDE